VEIGILVVDTPERLLLIVTQRRSGFLRLLTQWGFAGSGPVFGFREAVADSLDLATEHTGAKEGAIGPANQVAHAVRGLLVSVLFFVEKRTDANNLSDLDVPIQDLRALGLEQNSVCILVGSLTKYRNGPEDHSM